MKLLIVESPNKCHTIQKYLGDDFKVVASKGHIRDLGTKGKGGLGIDFSNGYEPYYVVSKGKGAVVSELRKEVKEADEVILATDPDREGEAIAWHLAKVLGLDIATTKRLRFHEITKPAVEEAMKNPSTIDMNLFKAQETRRMYDRIIGFPISGLLNKKINSPSAGRVQSATLRMITDNDKEIASFVPKEYWTLEIELKKDGHVIKAVLEKIDGKKAEIADKTQMDEVLKRMDVDAIECTSLILNRKSNLAPLPFSTSTMLGQANTRFNWPANKIQSVAQRLYERGFITYMRTDSTRIAPSFYQRHAVPFITETYGAEYIGPMREEKKVANMQDAHEGIRMTGTHRTPDSIVSLVTPDEAKLYKLIYQRALASLMAARVYDETSAIFECNGLTFKASGQKTVFPGYTKAYVDTSIEADKELPSFKEGESLKVSKKNPEQKFTNPPLRYNDARLIKAMEDNGIGRPSTYASTIQTLIERKYVARQKGNLIPTEQGVKTDTVLGKYFPDLVSTQYTAKMEKELDEIEKGNIDEKTAMDNFYYSFQEKFEEASGKMYKDPAEATGEKCPECGHDLVLRNGKNGSFVGCSNYPECHYIKKEAPKEVGRKCPLCGRPLVFRKDRKGKEFVGCSGYPVCTYTESERKKPLNASSEKKIVKAEPIKKCPDCDNGYLVLRHSKKGDFLGCNNYPRCRHVEPLEGDKDKK